MKNEEWKQLINSTRPMSHVPRPTESGYAITGLQGAEVLGDTTLAIFVNTTDEPDIRSGESPTLLQAQLVLSGLTKGSSYTIYRWDSYEDFPTNGLYENSKYSFKYVIRAGRESHEMEDDNLFLSSGSVYYRCVLTNTHSKE